MSSGKAKVYRTGIYQILYLQQEMERKSRLQRKFEQAYDSSQDVHTRAAALLAVIRTTNAAITPEQCYAVERNLFRMQGMLPIIALFSVVNP